jgi:polyisoprenyl-phosphate glycosyltransferase
MARSDCFVSVVAPLDNDADIVEGFVTEVVEILKCEYENYELVLVDDGSSDDTVRRVSALLSTEPCIRLLRLSRRFGRDTAISAGLDTVIGDFVVVIIPESDPPRLIPEIVERCRSGSGIVYGIHRHRAGEPLYMRLGAKLFYWCFNRILRIELPPNSTDFRVYSRQSVNAITKIKDRLRYLRTFSSYVGYGNESFEYEPTPRRTRPRNRGFFQAVGLAINLIVASSSQPLRLVSVLGLTLSALCLVHIVYVASVYLFSSQVVAGWTTSQLYNSGMYMFIFLILATLCEYMGRLQDEARDRPLYYILEERCSSVMLVDEARKNVVDESL